MQIDRQEGRVIQIEAIIGRPVRIGRKLAVSAPGLESVYAGLIFLPEVKSGL
jgi:ketopantoate reductase